MRADMSLAIMRSLVSLTAERFEDSEWRKMNLEWRRQLPRVRLYGI
jgi:hypothetical protein